MRSGYHGCGTSRLRGLYAIGSPRRISTRKKLEFRDHKVILRIRKIGSKYLQTIKAEDESRGDLARLEHEHQITSDKPQLKYAKYTPLAPLISKKLKRKLRPIFRTDVRRARLNVRLNGSDIERAFDRGRLLAGKRTLPICELEIELKKGMPQDVALLAWRLQKDLPVAFEPRTKGERGYALLKGEVASAVRATPISLGDDLSSGEAFSRIGMSCLHHLAANAQAAVAGQAEGDHQMRVGLRRLRAAISLFRDVTRDSELKAVTEGLRWLMKELAPARDVDVLVKAVTPMREANPDKPEIAVLEKNLKGERTERLEQARETVSSDRFRQVVLQTVCHGLLDRRRTKACPTDFVRGPGRRPQVIEDSSVLVRSAGRRPHGKPAVSQSGALNVHRPSRRSNFSHKEIKRLRDTPSRVSHVIRDQSQKIQPAWC
jgi:triphosphatase